MRRRIIAGNWKLYGTIAETEALISDIKSMDRSTKVQTIVCPPYTSLQAAHKLVEGTDIALGAQEVSSQQSGAYTGEISAEMLLTVGVTHVILGHSERRQYHGETDSRVNARAKAALAFGLTPIICVGETLDIREEGLTEAVVGTQIDGTLADLTKEELQKVVIAYEPVWAIGTGKTATPEMAQAVHKFIRSKLPQDVSEIVPILYGGSVKPGNAADLLAEPDIDGALVGGASLKADDFVAIINAV
jgi:triosephosphate isomerase